MSRRSSSVSPRRLIEHFGGLIETCTVTGRLNHMTRGKQTQARRYVSHACRERYRARTAGLRKEAWVPPFWRAHLTLHRTFSLIAAGLLTAGACRRRAQRRPRPESSREMQEAVQLLAEASSLLRRAALEIAAANASMARDPRTGDDAPEILAQTTERWAYLTDWLREVTEKVLAEQRDVLARAPERPAERRPRIVLAPRPAPVRAFLRLRQPRVHDRITPLLLRRRRIPRPAALRVPRRDILGRAPPLVSDCLL
jgi:hypothetical protein